MQSDGDIEFKVELEKGIFEKLTEMLQESQTTPTVLFRQMILSYSEKPRPDEVEDLIKDVDSLYECANDALNLCQESNTIPMTAGAYHLRIELANKLNAVIGKIESLGLTKSS